MAKIRRVITIIITTILTLVNLWQIVPKEFFMKTELYILLEPMLSNSMFYRYCCIVLGILGVFAVFTMIVDLKNIQNEHSFSFGSFGFRHFFAKWYSQPGTLSIICDDLKGWLVVNGNEDILNALRQKSSNGELHLILGNETPTDIVNELKSRGAMIHKAPRDIISNYSFSCISVMGNNAAVIIRNKQKDEKNIIKFEEISNTYVTGLLNALIENIKGESM